MSSYSCSSSCNEGLKGENWFIPGIGHYPVVLAWEARRHHPGLETTGLCVGSWARQAWQWQDPEMVSTWRFWKFSPAACRASSPCCQMMNCQQACRASSPWCQMMNCQQLATMHNVKKTIYIHRERCATVHVCAYENKEGVEGGLRSGYIGRERDVCWRIRSLGG